MVFSAETPMEPTTEPALISKAAGTRLTAVVNRVPAGDYKRSAECISIHRRGGLRNKCNKMCARATRGKLPNSDE